MSDPFVYLAKRSDGVWKIGFSENPARRMKELRSFFGKKFKLVKAWQHPMAYQVERLSQKNLRLRTHLATSGWETFKAPRKVIITAIEEAMEKVNARI